MACCGSVHDHEHAEVVSPRMEKGGNAAADVHTGDVAARAGGEMSPAAPVAGSTKQLGSTTGTALAS